LSKSDKRQDYDRSEHTDAGTTPAQKHPPDNQRGPDIQCQLTISFVEAVFGCQKEVEVSRWENCSSCQGTGTQPGTKKQRCSTCQGQGRVHNNRRVVVYVPAGVDNGINVRVMGEGEISARGGTPGNLYVSLTVQPHPIFKRQGNDLIYELPITTEQAALGAEVPVLTLEGKVTIKIPPGTQSGSSFRLKGMGVPVVHSTARGDQYVIVRLVTPRNLTQRQAELLKEFAEIQAQQDERSVFEKIKDAFQTE
ncbi:MAG TPA: DnaJ C-terminal domain-containing protein, partial [Ktedonobacterales bacterium]